MGSIFKQPEKPVQTIEIQDPVDVNNMDLRPSDEESTNVWSTNETSDLLF